MEWKKGKDGGMDEYIYEIVFALHSEKESGESGKIVHTLDNL